MKILTVTSLFPHRGAPTHGVFILERLKAVAAAGADVKVIAPMPYVPPGPLPRRYSDLRVAPRREVLEGLQIRHPRYFMIPKIGMRMQARWYARGIRAVLREEVGAFRPDLIDAHYLYPDVCGAALVARDLGLPYVCSARGSDVKVLGRIPSVRRQVRPALADAAAVIAVSSDLADWIRRLGLHDGPISVISNGVDPVRFRPRPRGEARAVLGLPQDGRLVVCVGQLKPVHGQEMLLRAMASPDVPGDVRLYLVGDGPQRPELEKLRRQLGLEARVELVGVVEHERIPFWFAAADASALLCERAGSPNVILESLACGTPCLASDLPEIREVITSPHDGRLVVRETAEAARGLATLLRESDATPPRFPRTWADAASEILACMRGVL